MELKSKGPKYTKGPLDDPEENIVAAANNLRKLREQEKELTNPNKVHLPPYKGADERRKLYERIAELEQRCSALFRQSQSFASLASERGARMQIMREWMQQTFYQHPPYRKLWRWFQHDHSEAADWFDEDGVPVREDE